MKVIGISYSAKQLFLSFVGAVLILLGVAVFVRCQGEVQAAYAPYVNEDLPTIIIDAGHGGMDGGAVGVNGVVEKEINLRISLKLAELLEQGGFPVILTRSSDDSIHDPDETSVAAQKRSDMYNRKAIMDANPGAIFLSIHQNKFGDPTCKGAQVFHSPNQEDSRILAQILQDQLREKLQPDNSRQIKEAGDNLFLLYNAQIPAVMVECGFLSNPEECALLCEENYQKKLAFAIYLSLLDFFAGKEGQNVLY